MNRRALFRESNGLAGRGVLLSGMAEDWNWIGSSVKQWKREELHSDGCVLRCSERDFASEMR